MSRFERSRSTPARLHVAPPARPSAGQAEEEELSKAAIRAIEEGRADHVAGRTFTMAEIRRELGIGALWYTDFTDGGGATAGAHDE